MRYFNTSGSCIEGKHYMLPPERRLGECVELIDKEAYFVLHAPRQTGKTTSMKALAQRLTAEGKYAALWFTCEEARAFSENPGEANRTIWSAIQGQAQNMLPGPLRPDFDFDTDLRTCLSRWAQRCPRPLVLIFDEIDAIGGTSLLSVLSQLRAGYLSRPSPCPWSVILCGMREVRDYKVASGGQSVRAGSASPFNIKAASIRLGNFTADEVRELYLQHTTDTGQLFTDDAMTKAWTLTEGQPWLVNALAREIIETMKVPVHEAITVDHLEKAKDRLILARATHIDSLLARLREDPVRRILEPIIAGEMPQHDPLDDDQRYVMDLGLIAAEPTVRIANPIYREVILRVLSGAAESWVLEDPRRYVLPNGMLDVKLLFEGFAEFWKQHGELLEPRMAYSEAAAQLVLVGFLHKIVNGGGQVEREIGVGKKRIDMMVQWPYTDEHGKKQAQRLAVEIKVWRDRDKKGDPLVQGLKQIDEYLARLGLDEGTLVIFDSRSIAEPIDDRTRFESQVTASGRTVTLLRA